MWWQHSAVAGRRNMDFTLNEPLERLEGAWIQADLRLDRGVKHEAVPKAMEFSTGQNPVVAGSQILLFLKFFPSRTVIMQEVHT